MRPIAKKALIIGISGQDGSLLAQLLLLKGYQVFGTSRDAQLANFKNLDQLGIKEQVTFFSMAVNDFRSVLQTIMQAAPDEIYNLSGQSSVGLSFEQPVETFESIGVASLNLLEAARFFNRPVKIYNACSSECFGNTAGRPANEETPFRPRSPYAVAKAAAFWQVANYREAYDFFACSGILFNHESTLRPDRFVTQKIVSAACRIALGSKEKLSLGNLQIERDWGWASEYVQAMWQILQQKQPQDFVIATGFSCKLSDFVDAVFSRLRLDWQDHVVCDDKLLRPTDILVSRADAGKARKILGWKARHRVQDVAAMMVEDKLARLSADHRGKGSA